VSLVVEVSPGLGRVWADPGQLEQVIVNLALNGRDAMPTGGTLRISVDAIELRSEGVDELGPGGYVRLRVTDTGIGMEPELAAQVFEPFFTTKPHGSGTGLGLATAYGAVREAGGVITVRSAPGEGAEFTILLPA
jgi:two-component system cell cycle sensor histidine kinase/response regulator CckA